MRNFYYVVSFNLTNPKIKSMLNRQKIIEMTGLMIDFKLRSKLYLSYKEALVGASDDFENKLEIIYPDEDIHNVNQFSVANPAIMGQNSEIVQELVELFGGNYLNNWDENCCSVMFFADNPNEEDQNHLEPNSWMFKYEILFTEDSIELSGNGDFVFSPINVPHNSFTSTYH